MTIDKIKAMTFMNNLFKNTFKYILTKRHVKLDYWNCMFKVEYLRHEIQMTFNFEDSYVDILLFPHPIIFKSEHKVEALKIVNYINHNIKTGGRFYVDDDYLDIAYSLRFQYNELDIMPQECVRKLECAVEYYMDIFKPLYQVCQGIKTYEEGREYIDFIWNNGDVPE